MIIDKVGRYKTNRIYKSGNACSVWTIPEGTEFTVNSVDSVYHQFYSDMFGDWTYWDKDVIAIK